MPNPIDPLAIATLGRITTNPNAIVVDGLGYYVIVEEEPIPPEPPIVPPFDPGGDGTIDFGTKELQPVGKRIKVKVCTTGSFADEDCKEYEYIENDINMSVRHVEITEDDINIKLWNPMLENDHKQIKISLKEFKKKD